MAANCILILGEGLKYYVYYCTEDNLDHTVIDGHKYEFTTYASAKMYANTILFHLKNLGESVKMYDTTEDYCHSRTLKKHVDTRLSAANDKIGV